MDDNVTPRGSPRMSPISDGDSDGDSHCGKKRSHASMAYSNAQVNGHMGASPPENGEDGNNSPPENKVASRSRNNRFTREQSPDAQMNTINHEETSDNEEESQDEPTGPDEPLELFNWEELEGRYHDMIKQKGQEEDELRAEFDALCQVLLRLLLTLSPCNAFRNVNLLSQYYTVWAQTISTHEVERSFKRYVNHVPKPVDKGLGLIATTTASRRRAHLSESKNKIWSSAEHIVRSTLQQQVSEESFESTF